MSLKKKMGAALFTTAMGAALIGGGTFALFTNEATNAGNTFTAGKVIISDATGGAALSTTSFISNLAPGDTENATVTVKNDGNLDAWVKIEGVTTNKDDIANNGVGDLFEGANPLQITHQATPVLIPHGESRTLTVGYNFPREAGNEYQGDTGSVTFNLKAVQSRNNTLGDNSGPVSWNEAGN
ncbi:TasA family protein [Bacillus sp. FJAT-29814]|uniref:TasA family protein n=1 Tax=Bacillus sp. FJAT-29814 TaxID=1729688 RepID=UPI00082E22E0|nr:TasA family protein [Bacillus sp. FJAT-29814]